LLHPIFKFLKLMCSGGWFGLKDLWGLTWGKDECGEGGGAEVPVNDGGTRRKKSLDLGVGRFGGLVAPAIAEATEAAVFVDFGKF
jgi:hypothetical protein